jgi:phosphatidylglycerol lysyltransferase
VRDQIHYSNHTSGQTGKPRVSPVRWSIAAICTIGLAALIAERLHDVDLAAVWDAILGVSTQHWLLATIAVVISFVAVAEYDHTVLRHLGISVPTLQARRAGFASIAVSQTLGFGVVTGTILRWRLLPGLTLAEVTRLSVGVMAAFVGGWAFVTATVVGLYSGGPFQPVALCGLVALIIVAGFCATRAPRADRRWPMPNAITLVRVVALAGVDLGFAALSLWVLMPAGMAFDAFLPAFLLAFGAGLLSGTPAGLGAFELVLLAASPVIATEDMLAAILVWRVLYYAVPSAIGACIAIWPQGTMPDARHDAVPNLVNAMRNAPADTQLTRQGCLSLLPLKKDASWMGGRTSHGLVAMAAPLGKIAHHDALCALGLAARAQSRLPFLYKIPARMALAARHAGWACVHVADEAVLNPATFDLASPSRAGLRRKLRKAELAGVTVHSGDQGNPGALEAIAADWARRHGGERGFSMGRYHPRHLTDQRLYVACVDQRPVAFLTLFVGQSDWSLDLMRGSATAPDGTMQALVVAALQDARQAGICRLSLAAVPSAVLAQKLARFGRFFARRIMIPTGLRQFKTGFAPQWVPLYAAAPGRLSLCLIGVEIAVAIRWPGPVFRHDPAQTDAASASSPEFAFAMAGPKWQIAAQQP